MPSVVSVDAAVYGIPEESVGELPVHRGLDDDGRIVYRMTEKELALPNLDRPPPEGGRPPTSPDSARALGRGDDADGVPEINQYNTPGLGLDVNALCFIGRLYGKNNLSTRQTNFIRPAGRLEPLGRRQDAGPIRDRRAPGDGRRRAGHLHLPRLAPARHRPAQRHRQRLGRHDARWGDLPWSYEEALEGADQRRLLTTATRRATIALLTEFLSPQSLQFALGGQPHRARPGHGLRQRPLLPKATAGVEVIRPSGMPLQPSLQLQAGLFLKLNFDLSTCASGAAGTCWAVLLATSATAPRNPSI